MRRRPEVVIFDLGGVLFDYEGAADLARMRRAPFREAELSRFWLESQWAFDIATGRCSPFEFARGAIDELGLVVGPDEFLAAFGTWLRGYLPNAEDLLFDLRDQTRLACFSNTNEIDASRFRTEFRVERLFDECFFSNEMGMRKPDEPAYHAVLDTLGVQPEDVLLLDDTPDCVEGAKRCGISAEVVQGPRQAKEVLAVYFRL